MQSESEITEAMTPGSVSSGEIVAVVKSEVKSSSERSLSPAWCKSEPVDGQLVGDTCTTGQYGVQSETEISEQCLAVSSMSSSSDNSIAVVKSDEKVNLSSGIAWCESEPVQSNELQYGMQLETKISEHCLAVSSDNSVAVVKSDVDVNSLSDTAQCESEPVQLKELQNGMQSETKISEQSLAVSSVSLSSDNSVAVVKSDMEVESSLDGRSLSPVWCKIEPVDEQPLGDTRVTGQYGVLSKHEISEQCLAMSTTSLYSDKSVAVVQPDVEVNSSSEQSLSPAWCKSDPADGQLVLHDYGEMWSVFREIPLWVEVLRAEVIHRHNNDPRITRLLSRYPSLRPSTWIWSTPPLIRDLQHDSRHTQEGGVAASRPHRGISQCSSYTIQPVIDRYVLVVTSTP